MRSHLLKSAFAIPALFCSVFFISACSSDDDDVEPVPVVAQPTPSEILISTRWKTTKVTDSVGTDVTSANSGFVGLADYNSNGTYIFYDLAGAPRGDEGTWALTADGKKRVLVSATRNYTRIVDIEKLDKTVFTYRTKNTAGHTVHVEHIPTSR